MDRYNIIKWGLFLLWLGGLATLGSFYDWKAAAVCWVASCCFGTAVLMENDGEG